MSYRCGTFGLEKIGIASGEPRLICDGCGVESLIVPPQRMNRMPPVWFLDGKAKPGWTMEKDGDRRIDYCGECKPKKGGTP